MNIAQGRWPWYKTNCAPDRGTIICTTNTVDLVEPILITLELNYKVQLEWGASAPAGLSLLQLQCFPEVTAERTRTPNAMFYEKQKCITTCLQTAVSYRWIGPRSTVEAGWAAAKSCFIDSPQLRCHLFHPKNQVLWSISKMKDKEC